MEALLINCIAQWEGVDPSRVRISVDEGEDDDDPPPTMVVFIDDQARYTATMQQLFRAMQAI